MVRMALPITLLETSPIRIGHTPGHLSKATNLPAVIGLNGSGPSSGICLLLLCFSITFVWLYRHIYKGHFSNSVRVRVYFIFCNDRLSRFPVVYVPYTYVAILFMLLY